MTTETAEYADPAVARDEIANAHRDQALEALEDVYDHKAYVAVTQALLALEARLEELCVHVSRLE